MSEACFKLRIDAPLPRSRPRSLRRTGDIWSDLADRLESCFGRVMGRRRAAGAGAALARLERTVRALDAAQLAAAFGAPGLCGAGQAPAEADACRLALLAEAAERAGVRRDRAAAACRRAAVLMNGGCAECPGSRDRQLAMVMAGLALAARGRRVHLMFASEAIARTAFELCGDAFRVFAPRAACLARSQSIRQRRETHAAALVFGPVALFAADFLRDVAGRRGLDSPARWRVDRLRGRFGRSARLVTRHVDVALVDEADRLLCEAGASLLTVPRRADVPSELETALVALGLAAQLVPQDDYVDLPEGPGLTARGRERLRVLAGILDGQWGETASREALVTVALYVLEHLGDGRDPPAGVREHIEAAGCGIAADWWLKAIGRAGDGLSEPGDSIPLQGFLRHYGALGAIAGWPVAYAAELRRPYGLWCHRDARPARAGARHVVVADMASCTAQIVAEARTSARAGGRLIVAAQDDGSLGAIASGFEEAGLGAAWLGAAFAGDSADLAGGGLESEGALLVGELDPQLMIDAASARSAPGAEVTVAILDAETLGREVERLVASLPAHWKPTVYWRLDHAALELPQGAAPMPPHAIIKLAEKRRRERQAQRAALISYYGAQASLLSFSGH